MNNMIKEYDNLRNEINQKIELHNTLLTFTITTTVAILTFALSDNKTILYLIPFCILIPMSMRIAYYRSVISKLSAYIIVFLEKNLNGIKWETRNAALIDEHFNNKKKANHLIIFGDYECCILAIVCYFFYFIDFIKDKEFCLIVFTKALLPLLLVIWQILLTIYINSVNKNKRWWIKQWNELKKNIDNNC